MRRLLISLVVVLALAGAGGWFALQAYRAPGPLAEARTVVVPRASLGEVAAVLEREGVVRSAPAFQAAAVATRRGAAIKAGEFEFAAGAGLDQVLDTLRTGKPVQHKLTVPEGLTAAQVAALLDRAPALDGDRTVPTEGMFLPETYAYEHGATRAAMVERGTKAMERALNQAWATRIPESAPLASPQQALVLASIVERETAKPEERARVAAVFLNRLRRGMKLQSDPTVVYGASGGLGVLDHGITRAELDADTPYNTYRIAGLPPGPISMPGQASLLAVTRPAPADDLFFVADGSGGHVFARTEPEHARNVAKWRELERTRQGRGG